MQENETESPTKKKRGPPPFKPTKKQRADVLLYVAGGVSEPTIAKLIGCCQNTLRKHFEQELNEGNERELAENLQNMKKAAKAGNVSAMKYLDARFSAVAAQKAMMGDAPEPAAEEATPRPPAIGKKEAAEAEAQTAGLGTNWADDLKVPTEPAKVN